jgi:two-component system sensor histidine kinase KdpD
VLSARLRRRLFAYLSAVGAPSAATVLMVAVGQIAAIPNVSLLYLPAILAVAVSYGTVPSLLAAAVAAVEYDFFLLRPLFTLTIAQVGDVLAFVVFAIVAVLTSQLAARARDRAESAHRRATESTLLYELGQALMSTHDLLDLFNTLTGRIVEVFDLDRCAVFLPGEGGGLTLVAGSTGARRDRAAHAAARYAYEHDTQVGLPERAGAEGQHVYIPLRVPNSVVGVLEAGRKRDGSALDASERRLLTSFAAQAALAISRAGAEEEQRRLQVLEESDRLKSALLSAVSHDLRTPLSSIKASATSLLLAGTDWSDEEGRELLETIDHEADRLNRLVGNLLDLSRIEAGALKPVLDWYGAEEIIDTIVPRLRSLLGSRPLTVEVDGEIPPVQLDLLRIEELLYNLAENAVKYTPEGTAIELRILRLPGALCIAFTDHGPGVAPGEETRIFASFYPGGRQGDRRPGTGLGLAICRGIAEMHGGTMHVEPTPGGGATFVVTLPTAHSTTAVPA